MLYRPWQILLKDKQKSQTLGAQLNVPDLVCDIISSRGMTAEKAQTFIYGGTEISSPFLLKNMQKAVDCILQAVDTGKRIIIFGDYDVDGVTSTALLYTYLDGLGAEVYYKLPSREDDGYGLSCETVAELAQKGVQLIITVDNGICAYDAVEKANELGIEVVVTDHHLPPKTLPNAVAVVDPCLADDESPFKALSGVGVAFKLICALEGCEPGELLAFYGDLVAIGTVADIMELADENREFVKAGLVALQNPERAGIAALLRECGLSEKEITAETISFGIAPRLNAAGRMDSANIALELLLCDDDEQAEELAKELCEKNAQRQKAEQDIAEEIVNRIITDTKYYDEKIIVVDGENFHQGVIGIVASRLVERFAKPAIVISIDETGEGKGSGRSVEGISLYDAISSCEELLLRFGGHSMAAGLSVMKENIPAFREKINEYAVSLNIPERKSPLIIDSVVELDKLTTDEVEAISMLAPFGNGNLAPLFCVQNATIEAVFSVSEGKHTRLRLKQGATSIYAVMFGVTPNSLCYEQGDKVDVALYLSVYEGRAGAMLSGRIKEIRSANLNEAYLDDLYLFDVLCAGGNLTSQQKERLLPSRAETAVIYKDITLKPLCVRDLRPLFLRIENQNAGKIMVSIAALTQLGLIEKTVVNGAEVYSTVQVSEKKDLAGAKILRALGD